MKKFYSFLFAAVALVGFAACNSDSTEEPAPAQENVGKMEFMANIGEDTKTQLTEDTKVMWCEDDVIGVVVPGYNDNKPYPFTIKELLNGGESAVFTGEAPLSASHYYAIYPYYAEASYSNGSWNFTVPANQAAVNGSFADGAAASTATAAQGENKLNFSNICAVLKFQVPATCNKVSFASENANVTVEGEMTAEGVYYAVVPATDHKFTVRIDGYLSKASENTLSAKANTIYDLSTLPAPEESGWELMGLNNWTNSAKMYKDLDWFVAYNITSSSNGFKFKKGDTWVGAKSEFSHKDVYAYPEGGSNILAEKSNTAYDFYYNPEGGLYMILPAGTDINQDIYVATDMFIHGNYTNYSGYGNWDKGRTPIVAQGKYFLFKEYTFSSNPEFKFSTSEEGWNWQYSTQNTLTENTWTTLNAGSSLDGNTKFSKAGTYDIYTTSDKNNRDKVLIITHGNAPAAMN